MFQEQEWGKAYYDFEHNVMVAIEGERVWVYRYKRAPTTK